MMHWEKLGEKKKAEWAEIFFLEEKASHIYDVASL